MRSQFRNSIFLGLLTLLGVSCSTTSVPTFPSAEKRERSDFVAHGKQGMIATAHPLASQAGLDMLQHGGNAVDAAVAASFAISVLRPQSTGIGGGGFLLYYQEDKRSASAYDFRERAPQRAHRDMYLDSSGKPKGFSYAGKTIPDASVNGHLSVGVPGLVAGLLRAHRDFGSLPLSIVMAPAIKIAIEGFPVNLELANAIVRRLEVLKNFPGSAEIFVPKGKPLQLGQLLKQSDLAKTLRLVSLHGADVFYKGEIAEKILAEMQAGKGIISAGDLRNYAVKIRQPLVGEYHGYQVLAMPPPSSGGVHIIEMLNMLAGDDLQKVGFHQLESIHLLTEVMKRAYADRAKFLGDMDYVDVPLDRLLSKEYAFRLRSQIKPQRITPSLELAKAPQVPHESPSTTHISVVDRFGNGVSTTQTINFTFGSGVVARGTGIVLNDEMDDFSIKEGVPNAYQLVGGEANAIEPGKTMLSSMSPTLIVGAEGKLEMVVGSPGGSHIISATLQTIINFLDYKLPLDQAVHAYRFHHQWLPDEIEVEYGVMPLKSVLTLQQRGYKVRVATRGMGDVQAIARSENGWIGVSDTRSIGKSLGY